MVIIIIKEIIIIIIFDFLKGTRRTFQCTSRKSTNPRKLGGIEHGTPAKKKRQSKIWTTTAQNACYHIYTGYSRKFSAVALPNNLRNSSHENKLVSPTTGKVEECMFPLSIVSSDTKKHSITWNTVTCSTHWNSGSGRLLPKNLSRKQVKDAQLT